MNAQSTRNVIPMRRLGAPIEDPSAARAAREKMWRELRRQEFWREVKFSIGVAVVTAAAIAAALIR